MHKASNPYENWAEMLQDRVSVLVIRASDATREVVFDAYLDGDWFDAYACLGATLTTSSMIDSFEASAISAIHDLAETLAIDEAVVATHFRRKLQNALDNFEYWNDGEDHGTQERQGEAA